MLKTIRNLLLQIIDNIDTGNSNITEEDQLTIMDLLKRYTEKDRYVSKYSACQYLRISRATFDNYVREGKLPRGTHRLGFKELAWKLRDLDEFVEKYRKSDNANQ